MNKLKSFLLGLGLWCSLNGISKAENVELVKPEFENVPSVTIGKVDLQSQTPDLTITINPTNDYNQNAVMLENASQMASPTGVLNIILKSGIYDKTGSPISPNEPIWLHLATSQLRIIGESDPISTRPLGFLNEPTGAVIKDWLEMPYTSTTLENIIFKSQDNGYPNHFIGSMNNYLKIKNCYSIGNGRVNPNQRFIGIGSASQHFPLLIDNCTISSFTYGVEIGSGITKVRNTKFVKNVRTAIIGNISSDFGTLADPGENLFYKNNRIMEIYAGTGYPIQWGYFYDPDGRQLKTLIQILQYFKDWRTTTTTTSTGSYGTHGTMSVGSDILIEPFHINPHPEIPEPSEVRRWNLYE